MFGLSGSETIQLLVTKITPGADLSATLQMVDYAPAVYTADTGQPPYFTGAQPYVPLSAPVIASARSDDHAMEKDSDGSGTPRILIALDDSALPATRAAAARRERRTAEDRRPPRAVSPLGHRQRDYQRRRRMVRHAGICDWRYCYV